MVFGKSTISLPTTLQGRLWADPGRFGALLQDSLDAPEALPGRSGTLPGRPGAPSSGIRTNVWPG